MRVTSEKRGQLSFGKKAFFALIVTVICFGCLEALLAVGGVDPLVVDRDPYVGFASHLPLFQENPEAAGVYLQTATNKLRYFNPQRFLKRKRPDTFRVFCVGGSTTFGRPFDDRTSYVNWLRELLPYADGDKNWEVINAGGVSYASYRLSSLMEELSDYSPDLFVVYTGHNEFLEERTYGDLKRAPDPLRGWAGPLLRTRTFAFVDRWLEASHDAAGSGCVLPGEVDAVLDHAVGPDAYNRDPEFESHVLDHFEFNLHRIVDIAQSAGAQVIFVTPAANLKDFSPFKSQHDRELDEGERADWSRLLTSAERARRRGELEEALSMLNAAEKIDDGRADLHYRKGQVLFDQGRFAKARRCFQRAIDQDVCPLRATRAIQALVERTAIARRVPLVDFRGIVDNACEQQYGHRCAGQEFFVDHVHPTVSAHRLLSLALIEAMSQASIVGVDSSWNEDAIALVSQRIDASVDTELQARALTNLAQVLSWAGKQQEAGPIAEQAVRLRTRAGLEEDPESMFYAAVGLAVQGRDSEAIGLLQRVVQRNPNDAQSQWRLAALLYDQNRFEDSLKHFRAAVDLDPDDAYSQRMMALAFIRLRRYEDAVRVLRQALQRDPDNRLLLDHLELAQSKITGG